MRIAELISILEEFAPISLQESYDNSGLIIGSFDDEIILKCGKGIEAEIPQLHVENMGEELERIARPCRSADLLIA